MSDTTTLRELFTEGLQDILHAERQLVKALPKMAKAASSPDLREALENHLAETEEHVARLEQAFDLLNEPAKPKVCAGMQGIIEEGSEAVKKHEKGAPLDAAIIAGGQRAEHYEMAVYGTLTAWAKALGHDDIAALLFDTLREEKAADKKLTELAEDGINMAAEASGTAELDEDEAEEIGREVAMASASSAKGRSKPAKNQKSKGRSQK